MKLITVNLHMLILSTIYSSFLIKIRPGINKYSRLSNIDSHINKYNNNNHHHIKKLMEDLNLPLNKTCNFINKYKFSNFINKTESFITPQISEKTTNFRIESFDFHDFMDSLMKKLLLIIQIHFIQISLHSICPNLCHLMK